MPVSLGTLTIAAMYLGTTAIPSAYLGTTQVFSSATFSPSSLFAASEPGVWYDPSDLTTLFTDTAGTTPVTTPGQTVARMNDKSGRGNHATQATAASRPTYQVDGGGRPYLSFDGVDDFMLTGTITPGTDKAQVFAGVRKLSDATIAIVIEHGTAVPPQSFGAFYVAAPQSTGASGDFTLRSVGTTGPFVASGTVLAPTTRVIAGVADISGDQLTLRLNGTQVAQSTTDQGTGNYGNYSLYIGRRAGTSLPFSGQIYSLIVRFGANLTAGQITDTETWVNGKTGAY